MAIYVYRQDTGELVSWCQADTDPVADAQTLATGGLVAVSGLAPLDETHIWDAASRSVVTQAAASLPLWVDSYQFIMLFTPAETAAIRASADPAVQHWLFALSVAQRVNLTDAKITQPGLAYLAGLGLIQPARVAQISAGQAPS